ncbi:MAG: hypothetical protein ACRDD7_05010 [Peptostreptococcaceae bacterium]
MGKLKGKTLTNSVNSLKSFHEIHDFDNMEFEVGVKVISKLNKKVILEKHVPVRVVFSKENQYISIGWQEGGLKNYRSKQLFERYNPNFNEMILNGENDSLEIHSIDSDKIIVIYY